MSRTWSCLLTLCAVLLAGLCAGGALAAPPSAETLACVSASKEGQVARDRGELLAARSQFRACAQDVCPGIVRKSCTEWLVDLDPRIPSLVVRVIGPHAQDLPRASLQIDGQSVELDGRPRELDPGAHELAASAPGMLAAQRTILLAERERARLLVIELELVAQPGPPAAPAAAASPVGAPDAPREDVPAEPARYRVPVGSWLLGGLGVAGIVSFAVLRVKAGQELQRLEDSCGPECPPDKTQPGRDMAVAADVSLGVGVAALAGAGAWALGSWLAHRRRAKREASTSSQGNMLAAPTRGGVWLGVGASY